MKKLKLRSLKIGVKRQSMLRRSPITRQPLDVSKPADARIYRKHLAEYNKQSRASSSKPQ